MALKKWSNLDNYRRMPHMYGLCLCLCSLCNILFSFSGNVHFCLLDKLAPFKTMTRQRTIIHCRMNVLLFSFSLSFDLPNNLCIHQGILFQIDKSNGQKAVTSEMANHKLINFQLISTNSIQQKSLPSKPANASLSTYVIWFPSNSSEFNWVRWLNTLAGTLDSWLCANINESKFFIPNQQRSK